MSQANGFTADFMIAAIEETWGTYKRGMKAVVKQHLGNASPEYLSSLYELLTDTHTGGWPPSKADMIKLHDDAVTIARDKAPRIDLAHRIEASTEPFVEPETAKAMLGEIIASLGSKAVPR